MVYRPTARVLTVLELLQSHGRMTGAELARRLEVNIRTVRDYRTSNFESPRHSYGNEKIAARRRGSLHHNTYQLVRVQLWYTCLAYLDN